MKKQFSTRIFSAAKLVVNFFYYLLILIAVLFVFRSIMGLLNLQPPALTFEGSPHNLVSIPVEWNDQGGATLTLPAQPLVSLYPGKRNGILKVPIRSTLGLSYTIFAIVALIGFTWFFGLLRQIFRHSRADSPFHFGNARRISQMGVLILISLLFSECQDFLMWKLAKPYVEAMSPGYYSNFTYNFSLDGTWIFGLVLLALAQVYRRGVELQQDNELTV